MTWGWKNYQDILIWKWTNPLSNSMLFKDILIFFTGKEDKWILPLNCLGNWCHVASVMRIVLYCCPRGSFDSMLIKAFCVSVIPNWNESLYTHANTRMRRIHFKPIFHIPHPYFCQLNVFVSLSPMCSFLPSLHSFLLLFLLATSFFW